MKTQVLFVQGGGEGTHDEWDNKLVDSLDRELGADYEIRYPRMPHEEDPNYSAWKAVLKKEFAELRDGALAIGHSIGGTILINALAEDPPTLALGGAFLIAAPFVGEGGWPSDDDDFEPRQRLGADLPRGVPVYLYHGTEDATAPIAHLDLYEKAIPQAIARRLKDRDHQLNDDLGEVARDIRHLR